VSTARLSVLFDLCPAFDGHYGIPQETRLSFSLLRGVDDLDVTGLIQHPALPLARGRRPYRPGTRKLTPAENLNIMSRLVATTTPRSGRFGPLRNSAAFAAALFWLGCRSKSGLTMPLDEFEGAEFGDFLWQSLFSKTLAADEFEHCRNSRYATLSPPLRAMRATALLPWPRRYARVDTSRYDVLIAQTPWPGLVHRQTQLVVRYHDGVPLFLPHTVKQPRRHQKYQLHALAANAKSALFACVSNSAKAKLLCIFPELESRSFVVHDCVAPDYIPSSPRREAIVEIVASRIEPSSEPHFGSVQRRSSFYRVHLSAQNFRFILMVGTLEPRKNHLGLLASWEALRLKSAGAPALVLVGSPGWQNERVFGAMRTWQQRGLLFHLSAVPSSEMRLLYAAAEAVVCPSIEEGFDLPAVEALCCGGVVAASDIPVHREVLEEAAAYFDPYSPQGICQTLSRILSADSQKELRDKALLQAAKFDKSNILRQWEEVFEYCRSRRSKTASHFGK